MLKKITSIVLLMAATRVAFSQTVSIPPQYYTFIKKADSLYKVKDYKNSALAFSEALKSNGWKGLINDRYNAAKSWALANNIDSAFFQLFRITEKTFFKDYDRIINESDFKVLHDDKRWNKLLDLIKQNKSFNFGFEKVNNFQALPNPWFQWGTKDYVLRIDSTEKHSGKYSMLIEPTEDINQKSFGCVAYSIPANYVGKEIEVKAYIKMEHTEKPIGLLLRIDGKSTNSSLEFDNMQEKGIMGTKDWTQYSVKLPLPNEATTIFIGAILAGSGRLWADDFQVLIDGKDINEAPLKKK